MTTQTIVVMFTDLVGSTALLTRLGARGTEVIAGHHLASLSSTVTEHGGEVVKNTGDGIMATFPSCASALDCAVFIQRLLDAADVKDEVGGRVVRIGISAGDADGSNGDWFGKCVVEASRLCAKARGGEILALSLVVDLAGSATTHIFEEREPMELNGLPGEHTVIEVRWQPVDSRPLTVVIADDSVLLRSGIVGLLSMQGFRVVGEAGDATQLLELVDAFRPDLAVVDIRMPPTHTLEGIRAAERLKEQYPEMGVLLLSQHLESRAALTLLETNKQRVGYLLKDRVADVPEFISALRTIADGGTALDREVVSLLMGRRRVDDPLESLTSREVEVLSLMAEGLSNQAISGRLVLGVRTVEAHIASIFSKLGLEPVTEGHRRVMAVVAYLRRP